MPFGPSWQTRIRIAKLNRNRFDADDKGNAVCFAYCAVGEIAGRLGVDYSPIWGVSNRRAGTWSMSQRWWQVRKLSAAFDTAVKGDDPETAEEVYDAIKFLLEQEKEERSSR